MEISQIKTSLSILTVLEHYNLSIDRNNRLCCPWHDDKTPSLQIYPKTNSWTCFSSNCSAGSGDQIEMIQKLEHIDKHEAIKKAKVLIGNHIIDSTTKRMSTNKNLNGTNPSSLTENKIDYQKLFTQFKSNLAKSTKAKNYLTNRLINHPSLDIGFNNGKWTHLKNCIVFPLRDQQNNITSLYGRSITNDKNQRHFYLPNRSGLYPFYPDNSTSTLILTESIIDAASLVYLNHDTLNITGKISVLALYGTNGLTDEHLEVISKLKDLSEIILCFDGDQAGQAAITKYAFQLSQMNNQLTISFANLPEGEDLNSLLQSHNPEVLTHIIENRQSSISTETSTHSSINGKDTLNNSNNTETLNTDNPELLLYSTASVNITILGGIRITGLDKLKVTLKIQDIKSSKLPLRSSLDLYHSRSVDQLCDKINQDFDINTRKASQLINKLTTALEEYRHQQLEANKPKKNKTYQMTPTESKAALRYLKSPKLLFNTLKDISASGVVGEEVNAMIGFIIYLSRKRAKPLHVMYLGASGSGKTHLQESLAALIPEEDKEETTSLSDQALYYVGNNLKGKTFLIEDLDGAENALYIIRELQSKQRIVKRVAWRDNKGHTQTITITAEGPVVISSCTTREKVYEDNANRCILLYIDESTEQDKKVMDYIKAKSAGIIDHKTELAIRHKIQNVQRLLKPITVINPFAELIDLPPQVFKRRRSIALLTGFIETITFYHQHQRPILQKVDGSKYIQTTYEDIQYAFRLLRHVLFSKSDELTKAARNFLEKLKSMIPEDESFYSNSIRKKLRLNASNMKRYMIELQRYGYIKVVAGSRYKGYEYKIVNYNEYTQLKSDIDNRLNTILDNVKNAANHKKSVVQ